jgi:hypothetical protein
MVTTPRGAAGFTFLHALIALALPGGLLVACLFCVLDPSAVVAFAGWLTR